MKDRNRKLGLGRGLSTLLADPEVGSDANNISDRYNITVLPIEKISPNHSQPRKLFDKAKLEELASSISQNGIIQPVIVRQNGSGFDIVAGERRWRAAQLAKIHEIPSIVLDLSDLQVLEYSIIENVQREDLNPIEEANSYKKLIDAHSYTQEQVSEVLGKSRSYIANMLRLLTLPKLLISFLEAGKLTSGHAKVLIGLDNAVFLARKIMSENLSVRQTEDLVRKIKKGGNSVVNSSIKSYHKDIDTINLEKALQAQIKHKVTIKQDKNKESGKLVIHYDNLDGLDKVCNILFN